MKKSRTIIIYALAILFSLGFAFASAMYRTEFIRWANIPLTYTFFALSIICPALAVLSLSFLREEYDGKPKKRACITLITAGVIGISSFLTTLIINNIIGKDLLATEAINTAMIVTTLLFLVMLIIISKKKPLPVIISVILAIIAAGIIFGKSVMEEKHLTSRLPAPAFKAVDNWGKRTVIGKDADFYISDKGDDKNEGSYEHPFATFEKAAEAVRSLDRTGKDKITVGVFPGEYRTSGITLSKEDSGTKDCPVIYGICGEGECVINAGASLNPSDFEKVTDSKALSRLSKDAGANVKCIDLKKYGITADDYGEIYAIGSYNTASQYTGNYTGPLYCELFINDKRQTLARYPNEGFLETEKVISTGYGLESDGSLTRHDDYYDTKNPESDVYGISSKLAKRIASWQTFDDVWMFGYWKYDWADASSPIGSFDAEKKTLSPKFVSVYGTKTGAPYYFFNVFEELDSPGEWYLDRDSGILYVYPDEDFENSSVDISLGLDSVLTLNDASYITFDGFTFKGTRGDGITVSGNSNTFKNCIIKNVAGNAADITGYDNLITQCEITHTGKGGIYLNGGEAETLKPGNNKADNNLIHDWAEIYQTYQPGVTLNGVGNICSHNEMYNTSHEAVTYSGNNQLIEYNIIHDVCLLSDDAGAIYSGRRWDWYGTVIRYNCIFDVGSGSHRPNGIYFDDALSGQTAYGNLLINVPQCGFLLGGGRDLTVKNNIILNSNDKPISYDARAIEGVFGGWFTHSSEKGGDMWLNLEKSPYKNEIWQKAYPEMTKFSDDFDDTDNPDFIPNPSYSDVSGNVIVNYDGKLGDIADKACEYSRIENNPIYKNNELSDIFTDYENGDYTLKEDSKIYDSLSDFEEIPLDSIGRYGN